MKEKRREEKRKEKRKKRSWEVKKQVQRAEEKEIG